VQAQIQQLAAESRYAGLVLELMAPGVRYVRAYWG